MRPVMKLFDLSILDEKQINGGCEAGELESSISIEDLKAKDSSVGNNT